jgi:predicted phage tail protein
MATALLDLHTDDETPTPVSTATRVLLCSPIRAADGSLRVRRDEIPSGQTVQAVIPRGVTPERIIVNGGVIPPGDYATTALAPHDEVLIIPQWGGPLLGGYLFVVAAGLLVSVAATALSYVLFPPHRPRMQSPDEPTSSFEGIQTAIGPGAVVPVIYGTHRVGGQLLSATVDQAQLVVDVGQQPRSVQAVVSPPTLSILLALGEGVIRDVLLDTIEINGQPIANFPRVQVDWRGGYPDQSPMSNFGATANSYAVGRAIPNDGVGITYTTNGPIEAFVLNIVFNEGLYHFTGDGNKEDNVVTLRYWYRISPGGGWAGPLDWEIAASRTAPVRLGIRRDMPGKAVFDIRVEYLIAKNMNETRDKWQPTLESVTEIQYNIQSYPNTALLGVQAVATDTLQGALPNITVEVRGTLVRIGTFAQNQRQWSSNPAWCVMDFLTNSRYGLGVPDADIDLPGFAAWAAYCDEAFQGETRHTLNYVLDHDMRAQAVLLEMMGGNRTILFKSEGVWTPRPTRNDPPVQLLNWANCTDLKLTYTRDVDRINVLEARFANEEAGYQQDVLTWPAIEHWPAQVRKSGVELKGVTKPSRVIRALQFELNRRRYETLALEMSCALDALVLQPHDLFRFSHPMPGWGVSGRLQAGSTTTTLHLDEAVQFTGAQSYLVYVRHDNDLVELKPVVYPGDVFTTTITLAAPLLQTPTPRLALWAFGYQVGNFDTATKVFRVVSLKRTSNNRVLIQAMIHNPSVVDEPEATPLPVTGGPFNPLGPPPPLISLVATEVTRVQASGASMRVANLSWDVAPLSRGFAPYGGATILRRTVLDSGQAGQSAAGTSEHGASQNGGDSGGNFVPITQVNGHVLDYDDFTILSGLTYVYRVIPVSSRGVPNQTGSRDALLHIAGPTTPDYYPDTPLNLRLKGQRVGVTTFEGRDIQIEWDGPSNAALYTETFFLTDYVVQCWMPGQQAFLRQAIVKAGVRGQSMTWAYTQEANTEDHVRIGIGGAQRSIQIFVWCRTNTGRISLTPAQITVTNPPPDMSVIAPTVTALFKAALIDYTQYVEPRDFHHYAAYLDTVTPPLKLYQDVGAAFKKIAPVDLVPRVLHYVYILPFDTFGAGIPTQIVSFTPVDIDDSLDNVPPAVPTGLALSTGTGTNKDGTVFTFVQAVWNANTESDLAGYEVHWRIGTSAVPTTMNVDKSQHTCRIENIPGNILLSVKLLAYDKLHNVSAFSAEVSITTGADTVAPAPPTNLVAIGSIRAIQLLWTPPPDPDYAYSIVYAASVNNISMVNFSAQGGYASYTMDGLGPNDTRYFWLQSVDTSGNRSTLVYPNNPTGGIAGTAGQLDTTYISSLAADKIIAGTIRTLVGLDVGGRMYLDGVNGNIVMYDNQAIPVVRVIQGRLGALSNQYGLQLFNDIGQLMWNFNTGATTDGIGDSSITAGKISAGVINAGHLQADTALITTAAQIASAIINDAHIQQVSADKLIAGTIQANVQLGVGENIFLRGQAGDMLVFDRQSSPQLRVMLGNLGAVGLNDYGLLIWNAAGQLMWDFASGAQTPGIRDGAVTTIKVPVNAITEAVVFNAGGSALGTDTTEIEVCNVTFPQLNAGDQALIWFTALGQVSNPGDRILINLREDSAVGPIVQQMAFTGNTEGSIVLQHVYNPPGGGYSNKAFRVTFASRDVGVTVFLNQVRMLGIRRQR